MFSNKFFTTSDVCAVVISYNDADAIRDNIESIISQVANVLVIDNNSTDDCIIKLKKLKIQHKFSLFLDHQNKGIATQLNRALQYCKKNNFPLLLSMDQDTVLAPNCVQEMLNVLNTESGNIASIGPNREYPRWKERYRFKEKNYLITSGNLVVVDIAQKIGGYFDKLFIDMVDIDFSLALRCAGYKVGFATNAQMKHTVGQLEQKKIFGHEFKYLSHSPERFYYIYRNRQIVCRKFFAKLPIYCIKMWYGLFIAFFRIVFENNSLEKIKMAMKGVYDGMVFDLKNKK